MGYEKVYEKNFVEIFKLTDRIYFRNVSWDERNQCNGGFIVFGDFVAAVDAPSIDGANEMIAEAALLFGKPIKYVFLTHGHWDHADGLPVFAGLGAIVIGSAGMLGKLEAEGVRLPEFSVGIDKSARIVIEDVAFEPFTIPGSVHSAEDMFIFIPSENMVFTGDAVAELPNLFFGSGDFDNWLSALDLLESNNYATICVGHGRVKDGGHFAVQKAYFSALKEAIEAQILCAGPRAARDKSEGAPEAFAKAALGNPDNAGAKKAAELAGERTAARHISALYAIWPT